MLLSSASSARAVRLIGSSASSANLTTTTTTTTTTMISAIPRTPQLPQQQHQHYYHSNTMMMMITPLVSSNHHHHQIRQQIQCRDLSILRPTSSTITSFSSSSITKLPSQSRTVLRCSGSGGGSRMMMPQQLSRRNNQSFSTNAATPATTPVPPVVEHPEIEVVHAENAPKAIGPYSQAIKACNTLYVSGCLGLDPKTAEFPSDDVQEQARQAITNLKRILVAGDSSLARVVKTTVLLTDINDFAKVNAVYSEYFTGVKPARTTYAVAALPKNAKVEIEAIALVGKGPTEEHLDEESAATNNSKPPNSEK